MDSSRVPCMPFAAGMTTTIGRSVHVLCSVPYVRIETVTVLIQEKVWFRPSSSRSARGRDGCLDGVVSDRLIPCVLD